jgi:outer membrane protein TolC
VQQDEGVTPVQFAEEQVQEPDYMQQPTIAQGRPADDLPSAIAAEDLPQGPVFDEEIYPIDLPSVLALAGASNLQIALATERVNAAAARADAAQALWIPSLSGGVVYNNHSGQIQATEGEVLNVNRNSLFVGGGAVLGNSPANGGSGGPARMFVDLPLVDAIFEPLAARQFVRAARADRTATFNDVLLQASSAYYDLVRA